MNQNSNTLMMQTITKTSSGTTHGSGKPRSPKSKKHQKQQKPAAKPSLPTRSYVSKCCNAPARKPKAFSAIAGSKDKAGLGHWRCSACGKTTKVTVGKPQAPEVSEVPNV